MRMTTRARGMTLIELLVAIALLAVITTMAWRGLDELGRASDRLLDESARWQDLGQVFARFGGDVRQPGARPVRIGPVNATPAPAAAAAGAAKTSARTLFAGLAVAPPGNVPTSPTLPAWYGRPLAPLAEDDDSNEAPLEFTRKSPTGRDEVRLGYRLRGSRLELLIWPVLDRAPDTRPQVHAVLDGVNSLRFRHLDAGGNWQEQWPPGDGGDAQELLPRAVEIELILRDGTHLRRMFALPG